MSVKGIRMFAAVLSNMQTTRGGLLSQACGNSGKKLRKNETRDDLDLVDIRLAQMLEEAKNSVKKEFIKITSK